MRELAGKPGQIGSAFSLAFLLCAISGSVDALAYLLFNKTFVGNMTGNTVLLAVAALGRNLGQVGLRFGVIACFVAGVLLVQLLLRRVRRPVLLQLAHFTVLGIEFATLWLLSLLQSGNNNRAALVMLLAGILGAQNAAFRQIGGVRLNTAFITGDLEKLGESAAGAVKGSRLHAFLFVGMWVGYGAGASFGAIGAYRFGVHGLRIPAVLVLAAALVTAFTPFPKMPLKAKS